MKKQLILFAILASTTSTIASFRVNGYAQSDYYVFQNKGVTDNFKLRSATIIAKGNIAKNVKFQIAPDFGQGKVELIDAYIDITLNPLLTIRSGKGKAPFGLERLQPVTDTPFIAFGYPTQIAPNREVGLSLYGKDAFTGLSYSTGLFNGAPDGGSDDTDNENQKDWIGRIFWNPTSEIGIGIAQSIGRNWISIRDRNH